MGIPQGQALPVGGDTAEDTGMSSATNTSAEQEAENGQSGQESTQPPGQKPQNQ
jgi:hypothetical protein